MAHSWTCRKCHYKNSSKRFKKCQNCGKARPITKKPEHMKALDLSYEDYIKINGGDFCGICEKTRKEYGRRFDRDHSHLTGIPRGLLCGIPCNKYLYDWHTPKWLRQAARYLEKAN